MSDLYSSIGQNNQKAVDSTTFGTRDLVFLQIDNGGQDLGTDYTSAGSYFFKLMQTLQQVIEIYGVGIPSGNRLTVIANRQTVPFGEGEEADAGGTIAALEDLINAHPDLSGFDVFHGKLEGLDIQNDC